MKSPLLFEMRERLIEAILPEVAFDGWSARSLRRAAQRCGIAAEEAFALFPDGAASLVAAFSLWADRRMEERVRSFSREGLSPSRQVRDAVIKRFEILSPWREASRRAASVLAMPQNAPLALRLLFATADAIWRSAGEGATDFSFYTKRLTLAALYAAAFAYWCEDRSPDFADTKAFLERRFIELGAIGALRQRLGAAAERLPNPLRLFRPQL